MSKINVTAAELHALAERARGIGTLEAFTDVALQWAGLAEKEIERLTAERDDHARWRADLADKLHDRETTISAAWEALRSAGVHSEATIDDGIRLLRRQLDECSQMLARQAATIRNLTRPAEEA